MEHPSYEHKYRYGKIEEPMPFRTFENSIKKARLSTEKESFMWLSYLTGARKSEVFELKVEQCQVTATHFIIDFGQRKKHSAITPPLEFPLTFPGVDVIIKQLKKTRARKPSKKTIYYQEETDQPVMKNGKPVMGKDGKPG